MESLETRRLFSVSADGDLADPGAGSLPQVTSDVSGSDTPLGDPGGSLSDLTVLSVAATDPAPGAVLNQSPTTLTITFNQPFDPFSVGTDLGLSVVTDGQWGPADSSMLSEPFDLTDPTNTLVVTVTQPLTPGQTYGIVLLGSSSFLTDLQGDPVEDFGTDTELGTFSLAQPGVTLANATDIGSVGPTAVVTSGALDFQADPSDVDLYQFTLAPGHFWRLGAEVTAQRDGGTLDSALTLFDAQGNPLKTDDVGRPDAPDDPYLFDGLAPGTYYLGVSGAGNLAGAQGGYDPVTGDPGSIAQTQPGGPYRLHVVADPADSPTQLLGEGLEWADPFSTSPTGIQLAFSGPMDLSTFAPTITTVGGTTLGQETFRGLEVVDQSGKTWNLSPVSYDEANSEFTFLFDQPLPAGHYSLVVPEQGSVTDLAGLTPVSPGEPPGVLASWDVAPSPLPRAANDLGTILSSVPVTRESVLPAGTGVTYRFVVPVAGPYALDDQYTGDGLTIETTGPNGLVVQPSGEPGAANDTPIILPAGVYDLQLIASGTRAVDVSWSLARVASSFASILDNGVGQGPALNLTLISPVAPASQAAPVLSITAPSGPSSFSDGAAPAPVVAASSTTTESVPASTVSAATSAPATSGLVLSLTTALVGAPTAPSAHVSAVGPGTASGTVSLAANSPGLLQGITYGQRPIPEVPSTDPLAVAAPEQDEVAPVDGAIVIARGPAAPSPDEKVLARIDWVEDLGDVLGDWFPRVPAKAPAVLTETPADPIALSRDEAVLTAAESPSRADLATPLGVGAVAVLALRLRGPIGRWRYRRKVARLRAAEAARPWRPNVPV